MKNIMSKENAMRDWCRCLCKCEKNRGVSMNAGAVSTSAGSVHVALWGKGAVPSALECHETGATLCVCAVVGNLQNNYEAEAS